MALIAAVYVCLKSFSGFRKNEIYTNLNKNSELFFLAAMYLQLVLGIVLYFFLRPENNPRIITIDDAYKFSAMRFWAVEHFSVMLFALLIAQIGQIFTIKLVDSRDKFKYASMYYGFSSLLIFASTGIYMIARYFGE
jgi:hypothetical protein